MAHSGPAQWLLESHITPLVPVWYKSGAGARPRCTPSVEPTFIFDQNATSTWSSGAELTHHPAISTGPHRLLQSDKTTARPLVEARCTTAPMPSQHETQREVRDRVRALANTEHSRNHLAPQKVEMRFAHLSALPEAPHIFGCGRA